MQFNPDTAIIYTHFAKIYKMNINEFAIMSTNSQQVNYSYTLVAVAIDTCNRLHRSYKAVC